MSKLPSVWEKHSNVSFEMKMMAIFYFCYPSFILCPPNAQRYPLSNSKPLCLGLNYCVKLSNVRKLTAVITWMNIQQPIKTLDLRLIGDAGRVDNLISQRNWE